MHRSVSQNKLGHLPAGVISGLAKLKSLYVLVPLLIITEIVCSLYVYEYQFSFVLCLHSNSEHRVIFVLPYRNVSKAKGLTTRRDISNNPLVSIHPDAVSGLGALTEL